MDSDTDSSDGELSTLIPSYCQHCETIKSSYTSTFIEFDHLYSPVSISKYCKTCYLALDVNRSRYLFLQNERKCFISKPWYYGIYESYEAGIEVIHSKFCEYGREYWWEFVSESPLHQGTLVQVMTTFRHEKLIYLDRNNVYIVYMNNEFHVLYEESMFKKETVSLSSQ